MDYRKLSISLLLLAATLAFGTLGYHAIEDMPLFDAFYMTLITITTVGFSEIKPLTEPGRVITIIIIVSGISIGGYSVGMLVRMLIEGEFARTFGRRKLERQIQDLKNHFIVCGFGRIGRIICEELHVDDIPFVVIERDTDSLEKLERLRYLYLNKDATSEDALIAAGIERARGLVTAVRSDADNVFITLTARTLRPEIYVMSRASEAKNEGKIKKAGATRVVSPYLIGAKRMAQVLKRPTVVDFIDIAMMDSHLGLMMEEARIGEASGLIGKTLIESHLRQDFGVIIVAIKKPSGEMIFNPLPGQRLEAQDIIVVLGKRTDLRRMNDVL